MSKKSRHQEFISGNETLKQRLLSRQLTILMIIALFLLPATQLRALEIGFKPFSAFQALFSLAFIAIYVCRRRLKLQVAALLVSAVVVVWCLAAALNYGILAISHLVVPFVTVFSSIVFGRRVALRFFWTITVGVGIIGALYLSRATHYQVDVQWYVNSWTSWFLLLFVQAILALWYLYLIAPISDATRKASEHVEAVLQGINDALLIHDIDSGAILEVNQTMCTMYGYSPEAARRLNISHLSAGVPPYTREDARGWMRKAISQGPQLFEWHAKDSTGRLFWVEVNMRLANLQGTERLLVMVRDISERKQAESDLRQVQANLSALIESTDDLIWSVDLEFKIVAFNCNLQRNLRQQYGTEICVGATPEQLVPPDDVPLWSSLYTRALVEGAFRQDYVLRNGKILSLSLNPVIIQGARVGVSVFGHDITDRARGEQALRESERKTRAIFDLSYGFIGLLTPEGRLLDVNKTALDFIDRTASDVSGKLFWDTPWWSHSPEAQQTVRAAVALAALGEFVQSEAIHLTTGGAPHIIQFTLRPVKNDAGEVTALIAEGRDITEEREAQSQLLASNEKFLKLFHSSPDAIVVTKLSDGKIVEVNTAFEKLSGYTYAELVGHNTQELGMHCEDDYARFKSMLRQERNIHDAEFTIKRRSGELSLVLASGELMEVDREPHSITIFHDITERKRAEVALRESEERYKALFERSLDLVYINDLEGRFIDANDAALRRLGYERHELPSLGLADLLSEDQMALAVDTIDEIRQTGCQSGLTEFRFKHRDGTDVYVETKGSALMSNGQCVAIQSVARDITERKRATERLALLRDTIDATSDGVYWLDEGGRCIYANAAGCTMLGYSHEELINLEIINVNPKATPQVWAEVWEKLRQRKCYSLETTHRRKDGSEFPVEIAFTYIKFGNKEYLNGFTRDISERMSIEQQLRQSQKMEAIGSLAGGVAHDFNNLLSVILNHTEFAMEGVPEDGPVMADLLEVTKASDRAATLTRQLLAFSRKQVLQPVSLNLNEVVVGVEKMLRRLLGEDIDIVQVLAPDLGIVRADPGQIEQVLLNLAVNARDAMPDGGELTIDTTNVQVDDEYAGSHIAVEPGPYVQLAVTDTGCGMDDKTQARIFEPFFTTKEKGRGTGLGLSTVYGIVKQSGGCIWVYSELGQGTTFKILLPLNRSGTAAPPIKPQKVPQIFEGSETILVVEDEETLRGVAKRILGAAGYTVLLAADGEQALRTSAEHAGPIHLLLTDVVMPRMNGRVLAEKLLQTRPEAKVIYMSGYTDNAIVHHGVLEAGTHFINKPIGAAELTRRIREVLDG